MLKNIGLSLSYLAIVSTCTYFVGQSLRLWDTFIFWGIIALGVFFSLMFIDQSRTTVKYLIDYFIKDHFEITTIGGVILAGTEIQLYQGAIIILMNKEYTYNINIKLVKYIDLITKKDGRKRMTSQQFLNNFPKE